jgi:hypothetical protein
LRLWIGDEIGIEFLQLKPLRVPFLQLERLSTAIPIAAAATAIWLCNAKLQWPEGSSRRPTAPQTAIRLAREANS